MTGSRLNVLSLEIRSVISNGLENNESTQILLFVSVIMFTGSIVTVVYLAPTIA